MKYIQWVCPACKLRNYLGVWEDEEEHKKEHRCNFCHSTSEITISDFLVSKVRFKRYGEDYWKCKDCIFSEIRLGTQVKWRSQVKNKLQYCLCRLDNINTKGLTERAVCDKRTVRITKSNLFKLKDTSDLQESHSLKVALQEYKELVDMNNLILPYCKKYKLNYIIKYESPLLELNLSENNYLLVTLSIDQINNHPTVCILVDIPETTPLSVCTIDHMNVILDSLRSDYVDNSGEVSIS